MICQILKTNGSVIHDDVRAVSLPGTKGEFQVLSNHAEIFELLRKGAITIRKKDAKPEIMQIIEGFCHFSGNTLTIIAKEKKTSPEEDEKTKPNA